MLSLTKSGVHFYESHLHKPNRGNGAERQLFISLQYRLCFHASMKATPPPASTGLLNLPLPPINLQIKRPRTLLLLLLLLHPIQRPLKIPTDKLEQIDELLPLYWLQLQPLSLRPPPQLLPPTQLFLSEPIGRIFLFCHHSDCCVPD